MLGEQEADVVSRTEVWKGCSTSFHHGRKRSAKNYFY